MRPTKYRPEYCEEVIEYAKECLTYFIEQDFSETTEEDSNIHQGYGTKSVKKGRMRVKLPTVFGFAAKIMVNTCTLSKWASEHEQFSDALQIMKDICAHITIESAAHGLTQSNVAKLILMNVTDWQEKTKHEHSGGMTLEKIIGGSFKKEK